MRTKTRTLLFAFGALLMAAVLPCTSGRGDELPALDLAAAEKVSFRRHVWPIVKRHCWGCHSATDTQGGLDMSSVGTMLAGGENGALFEPGQPDESLLLDMISGEEPEMPRQQPPLSTAKIQLFRHWILAGARDDSQPRAARQAQVPERYSVAPAVTSVAWSTDGQQLAAACYSEVVLITPASEQPARLRIPTEIEWISHLEYSPHGRLLAVVGGSPARFGEVRLLRTRDGGTVSTRRFGSDTLFRGSFSPTGEKLPRNNVSRQFFSHGRVDCDWRRRRRCAHRPDRR